MKNRRLHSLRLRSRYLHNLCSRSLRLLTLFFLIAALTISFNALAESGFEVGNKEFILNGKPFQIRAAELHYPRIPREYWQHRIQMCKALGMNTICVYVFWNYHEPTPGEFDFSGQKDIREFIELCDKEGMKVIVRPGPYVCAEWEMGGLPWWLLKEKDIRLREDDPRFIAAVERFEDALAKELKGLTDAEGGPIIMIQVENEYGSYGIDKNYVGKIRDTLKKNYPETVMFQCDWSSNFTQNGLDDLLWTLNFGTGADVRKEFAQLQTLRPESPLMCSEYWSGWFDKWGSNHETRPATDMVNGLEEMIKNNISFSLYMTHGGTNFSHWAGANSPGYAPDVTSYDYDAPISESGAPTKKYYELRVMQLRNSFAQLPEIPDTLPTTTLDTITFTRMAPLFHTLPQSVTSDSLLCMEDLDQGYGSVLYRTRIPSSETEQELVISGAHDYALVWLDGNYIGKLDRRYNESVLMLPSHPENATLDILVEATGRINFGRAIKDYKGITGFVAIDGSELNGWEMYPLPDDYDFYASLPLCELQNISKSDPGLMIGDTDKAGVINNGSCLNNYTKLYSLSEDRLPPGVYRATFNVTTPADTWLDFSSWGKGVVYVNGYGLGRIWETGPQQTLYTPGCWLKEGENELLVFDVKGPHTPYVVGLETPIYDVVKEELPNDYGRPTTIYNLDNCKEIASLETKAGEWQEQSFSSIPTRYVLIETDASDMRINELYLLDANGEQIERENWQVIYCDSEEKSGNHTADKILDLQETTYWQPGNDSPSPHRILIDMGTPRNLATLRILTSTNGSVTLRDPKL